MSRRLGICRLVAKVPWVGTLIFVLNVPLAVFWSVIDHWTHLALSCLIAVGALFGRILVAGSVVGVLGVGVYGWQFADAIDRWSRVQRELEDGTWEDNILAWTCGGILALILMLLSIAFIVWSAIKLRVKRKENSEQEPVAARSEESAPPTH